MQEDQTPQAAPPATPEPERQPRASSWSALFWVRDLMFSVLIAVVMIVFIYQPVKVEGTSMMPALSDQERIFVNKFTYRFGLSNIERGWSSTTRMVSRPAVGGASLATIDWSSA